ncbi:MAG: hypothetical protein IPP78_00335 [Holophagaceae bacterium]|nr:hypothetical protein [Holophagaceae bacterium]
MSADSSARGAVGPLQARFEDGLRFLATALALQSDHRNSAATLSAACDAMKCFLSVLQTAADRHLEDRGGEILRLKTQCEALLFLDQEPESLLKSALEAARLSRDQAAALLPKLGG